MDTVEVDKSAVTQTEYTAKVFMSGNSQAVRLPKAFRFDAGINTLEVQKVGDSLVLTPKTSQSSTWESRVNAVFADLANTSDATLMEVADLPPVEREAIDFHKDWALKGSEE